MPLKDFRLISMNDQKSFQNKGDWAEFDVKKSYILVFNSVNGSFLKNICCFAASIYLGT